MARNEADKIYKRESGTAAMTGATERAAMAKEYGNNLVGDAVADIAAQDTARKDRIEDSYTGYERQLKQQQIALDQQRANDQAAAGAQLISGLGSAAAAYMGTYMGSPGGAGVTASKATNQLQNMGGGVQLTNEMKMADAMKHYTSGVSKYFNPGYNYMNNPDLQRMMYEMGYRPN